MTREFGPSRVKDDRIKHQGPIYADERVKPCACEFCGRIVWKNLNTIGRRGYCAQCDKITLSEPTGGFLGGFIVTGTDGSVQIETRDYARAGAVFDG